MLLSSPASMFGTRGSLSYFVALGAFLGVGVPGEMMFSSTPAEDIGTVWLAGVDCVVVVVGPAAGGLLPVDVLEIGIPISCP